MRTNGEATRASAADGCRMAAAIALGVSCWVSPAGSADRTTGQEPTAAQIGLRAGIELVLVDMRVMRDGRPVIDLRPDEVTLLVDGIPRDIASLTYAPVAMQASESERPSVQGPLPRSRPFESARPDRRLVVVVYSESLEPGDGRQLRDTSERFVHSLPADVAIAIATLPIKAGIRFAPDRKATVRALRAAFQGVTRRGAALEGIAGFGCSGQAASEGCGGQGIDPSIPVGKARDMNRAAEWLVRGRQTLSDLQWLFRTLDDGPSDVIIIAGGLPYHPSLRSDVDRALAAARASGTRVHAVEVADLTRVAFPEGGAQTAHTAPLDESHPVAYGLPEESGGIQRQGAVSGADFFSELSRALSSTYLLAFEPSASDRDGRPHRIDIRVARQPKPAVHARRTFTVTSAPRQAAAPIPPAPPERTSMSPAVPEVPITASNRAVSDAGAPPATLLQRASEYVNVFQRTFSNMVLVERYVQLIRPWSGDSPVPLQDPELEWREHPQGSRRSQTGIRRRQLLSDLLLLQPTDDTWIGYRDVAEVDGTPVRNRTVRVERLFLSDPEKGRQQLQRIATESARYNLGPSRNINLPTFPLQLLQPGNLSRFEWTAAATGRTEDDPADCALIAYRELGNATMVRTDGGFNVPMTGQFCIEPETGRVWRATVRFRQPLADVDAAFEVRFRAMRESGVLAPESAWEWSLSHEPGLGRPLMAEGLAIYSDVRRFNVITEERFK